MKDIIVFLFFIFPLFTNAQEVSILPTELDLDSLVKLNNIYLKKGDFTKAVDYIVIAKKLSSESYGIKSLQYAKILNVLGDTYTRKGSYEEAYEVFEEATGIYRDLEIDTTMDYASLLENNAFLLSSTGKYGKADSLYHNALKVIKGRVGDKDGKYANCQNRLGIMYYNMGRLDEARPCWMQATSIWKDVYGVETEFYSAGLHNLGNLHWALSRFEEAEKLYQQAVEIRVKILEPNSPQLGISYLCLGSIYSQSGKLEEAEPLLGKAVQIFENSLGSKHPYYLDCMNNLALFYSELGDIEQAIQTQKKVISIQEELLGKKNSRFIDYLGNMIIFHNKINNLDSVGQYISECLQIHQEHIPDDTLIYTDILMKQSRFFEDVGKLDSAESTLKYVKFLLEESKNQSNINHALCNFKLGVFYAKNKNFEEAIPYLVSAKNQYKNLFGNSVKSYKTLLYVLGSVHSELGMNKLSAKYYNEALNLDKQQLSDATRYQSDRELHLFINEFNHNVNRYISEGRQQSQYAENVYNHALFYKGFIQSDAIQFNQVASNDSTVSNEYLLLKSYNRRIAEEYSKPVLDRTDISTLLVNADKIEKKITRTLNKNSYKNKAVTWNDVKSSLKRGAAAIEFIKYQIPDTDSVKYAAAVIKYTQEKVTFISLFDEIEMDSIFNQKDNYAAVINKIYQYQPESKSSKDLNQLIVEPLSEILADVETIYYSPVGLMNRLNFGAIQIGENTLFGEKYRLNRVLSTRQLITGSHFDNVNKKATLFGGIVYDANEKDVDQESEIEKEDKDDLITEVSLEDRRSISTLIETDDFESPFESKTWPFLKWTNIEIDAIEFMLADKDFEITIYRESYASEESFKAISEQAISPRIIHLATHGFFFGDIKHDIDIDKSWANDDLIFIISENPMIRSGLILANANYAWINGKPIKKGKEDGILTSFEISQMDLSDTELVVLSACETGLGQINGNEGIYGLQRAFKIAGVKYIIMSLWQVPDYKTQELMTAFYFNYLQEEMKIHEAFRLAQQEMRSKNIDPFSWAGFVLVN